jgi:hypothetical protein
MRSSMGRTGVHRQRRRRGVLQLPGVGSPLTPGVRQHPPGPGRRTRLVLRVLQPPPAQFGRHDEPGQLRKHRGPRPGSGIGSPPRFRGEPQTTRSDRPGNLVPLTRFHHRLKTHGGWQVHEPFPGIYLWRAPHGSIFLVDHTGTRKMTDPLDGTAAQSACHKMEPLAWTTDSPRSCSRCDPRRLAGPIRAARRSRRHVRW